MKELKKINLPDEIVDSIEYSFFMKEADKEILDNILTKKSGYDYDNEIFDYFYQKYLRNRTLFELKIREATAEYAGEEYLTEDKKIEINFLEGIMYIYEDKKNRRISRPNN
ncbi:hypothetical protein [Fusobacterium sp.]|uniref:hypothetical protein n=1 Tax=Fusobacterium sp. TaxID=68766 RepID=UPI0026371E5A|nr:hypothetical protein [Fusobacterium sp.]